ncbi:hypothetical protein HYDPIDRAFT_22929 [Hydnomerulius pinastri MD-312]|nr:hypothetical protein HYDPIDRAFT_22929 [Hydnomerulius pinastri MD-312]
MSMTITAHSPTSSKKKYQKGGYAPGSPEDRGPTRNRYHHFSKKAHKYKANQSPSKEYLSRPKKRYADRNTLLNRLSPQSPTGTLLDRIGVQVDDDGEEEVMDLYADLPDVVPHYHTPEPGEVERFLESVIGAPPEPPMPACLVNGTRPTLAVETHNLSVEAPIKVEDLTSSVLYSPTETAVNSLLSGHTCEEDIPHLEEMTGPFTSALEQCRRHLVPVVVASAQARDAGTRLDFQQCAELLSDDRCRSFLRQAKETRRQVESIASRSIAINGSKESLKRNRVDEMDAWSRNTRGRFNSMDTVVSETSRRDSEITLIDFPVGRSPPKAPRAMLQGSHCLDRSDTLVPPQDSPSTQTLIKLVRDTIRMFPSLSMPPPAEPAAELHHSTMPDILVTGVHSGDTVLPPVPSILPAGTDFVSRTPTGAGVWFKTQGKKCPDVVDIDIDLSEDLFIPNKERPQRVNMDLRLCSFPAGTGIKGTEPDASLQDIDAAFQSDLPRWPKKGTLIIQVNPESEHTKAWLPHALEFQALDVTTCMVPGKNTFRFIHLSDLSDFTFVLAASPLPPEEAWRSWDWASIFKPTSTTSSEDEPPSILSEFAQIPVTVQS